MGVGVALIAAAVIGAGVGVYQAENQKQIAKKTRQANQQAQRTAQARALRGEIDAAQRARAANRKPNMQAILAANSGQQGLLSSNPTNLTGPGGIPSLGGSTLA